MEGERKGAKLKGRIWKACDLSVCCKERDGVAHCTLSHGLAVSPLLKLSITSVISTVIACRHISSVSV